MEKYTIGQVCRLLQVKPHVLRYWEQEIPLLAPRKDISGKRLYSFSNIQKLLRVRYLLYEKRFTLEGARNRLWEELQTVPPDLTARIMHIRKILFDIWRNNQKNQSNIKMSLKKLYTDKGQKHLFAGWKNRTEYYKDNVTQDLAEHIVHSGWQAGSLKPEQTHIQEKDKHNKNKVNGNRYNTSRTICVKRFKESTNAKAQTILYKKTAFILPATELVYYNGDFLPMVLLSAAPVTQKTVLRLYAEKIMAVSLSTGVNPFIILPVTSKTRHAVMSFLKANNYFGFDKNIWVPLTISMPPAEDDNGKLALTPEGGLYVPGSGDGGFITVLRDSLFQKETLKNIEWFYQLPQHNPIVDVPEQGLIESVENGKTDIAASVVQSENPVSSTDNNHRYIPTGVYMYGREFLSALPHILPARKIKLIQDVFTPGEQTDDIKTRHLRVNAVYMADLIAYARNPVGVVCSANSCWAPIRTQSGQLCIEESQKRISEKYRLWCKYAGILLKDVQKNGENKFEIPPLFAHSPPLFKLRAKADNAQKHVFVRY